MGLLRTVVKKDVKRTLWVDLDHLIHLDHELPGKSTSGGLRGDSGHAAVRSRGDRFHPARDWRIGWGLLDRRRGCAAAIDSRLERSTVGSVIKKRRKRMAKKKHRKLLKKTRIQRRRQGK